MSLKIDDSLNQEGCIWLVDQVTPQENERFTWLEVFARWSNFGRRPAYYERNESRRFLLERRFKEGGHYVCQ